MELALRNKVDTDVNRFFVVDRKPTGDEIFDDVLGTLLEVGSDVLREEEGRFLWIFHTSHYPLIDDSEQREVRARLRQLILTDEIPDPRDVVLLFLVEASGLLRLLLFPNELARRQDRIDHLKQLDLIGQAVAKTVEEIASRSETRRARSIDPKLCRLSSNRTRQVFQIDASIA